MTANARAFSLIATLLVSCISLDEGGETGVGLYPENDSPVLASASFELGIFDTCHAGTTSFDVGPGGKLPTSVGLQIGVRGCEATTIETVEVDVAPEGILEVSAAEIGEGITRIPVEALSTGTVEVTVRVTSDTGTYVLSGSYRVALPDEVSVMARSDGTVQAGSEATVGAGVEFDLLFDVRYENWAMVGYDHTPFEIGALELVASEPRQLRVRAPATPQDILVTYPDVPEFAYVVHVVTP